MEDSRGPDLSGIQVCVRVRPLNDRERDAGFRNCVSFDEGTHQVVLSAVDKSTLMQLRGQTAKGYAFDRRYGPEHTSDNIFDDCVTHLVDNLFKGYNGTVLAYGQTGAGKTLTMSGGKGIYGNSEKGIIRRAAEQIVNTVDALRTKLKPGESITVKAYGLELYNEELRDLSTNVAGAQPISGPAADGEGSKGETGVRIAERPIGRDGKCIPEVVGVNVVEVQDAESLVNFFADCFDNRAVAATKMNDRSSRSHAIYTVLINRTLVDVSEGGSKVRTERVESRFNLVDLAGSERVKRSGVTGAAFKEAVHINGGLLALGNVIVALSGGHDEEEGREGSPERPSSPSKGAAKKHIPYRDSKLTRLLQDSLGGTALTILISCVSSCEADFEETNSTLKYANRACKIKNSPLPNKQLLLEEDLLPLLPTNSTQTGNMSMMQMQLLLAEHNRMKEAAERREKEKKEKEEKRLAELRALKESQGSAPGYQRLRMAQYDELRKKLVSSHGGRLARGEVIQDDTLVGFKKRNGSEGEGSGSEDSRPATASKAVKGSRPQSARLYTNNRVRGSPGSSPWDSDGSRAGTPEILTVGENPEAEEADIDAEAAPNATSAGNGLSRFVNAAGEEIEIGESAAAEAGRSSSDGQPTAGQQAPVRELHEMAIGTDDGDESALRGGAMKLKQPTDIVATVEEGTCTTPDSIKACYDPESPVEKAEAANSAAQADIAAAQAAGGSTIGRRASLNPADAMAAAVVPPALAAPTAATAAAYSVLAFQEEQQQQQGQAAANQEIHPEPLAAAIPPPQLLARFKVNHSDTLAVFRAVSPEDFADVAGLLPPNTALPAADKMTYLVARLEVHPYTSEQLAAAIDSVAAGACGIGDAVGPAVGCLMATFGTSLITDCIFDFEDPEQLQECQLQQRLELWGLQIPHTPIRPALQSDEKMSGLMSNQSVSAVDRAKMRSPSPEVSPRRSSFTAPTNQGSPAAARRSSLNSAQSGQLQSQQQPQEQQQENVTCWSSMDRLNVSIGLMYALCNLAKEVGAVAGFCVPRPQLLRRWLQSGVKMRQVSSPTKLIYPSTAHDYSYYKSSTVAYFLIDEVRESLTKVLSNAQQVRQSQEQ